MQQQQKQQHQKQPPPPPTDTISLAGSVVLTVNNLMGPGMLAVPVLFQQAGWFPTLVITIVFFVVASFSAIMLCESIDILNVICEKHPSLQFSERREFSNIVRFFFGDAWYLVSQLAFNISLQSLNIASIIVSAQAVDNLLIYLFQTTYAMELTPHLRFVASSMSGDSVFPEDSIVLTLGYLLLMAAFLPLGFLELQDNVNLQYVSFTGMTLIMIEFMWHFWSQPWHTDETPFMGQNMTQLVGILAFSFSFTTLVPSWYNEKHPSVSTNMAIWMSTGGCACVYLLIGLLAAWAYPFIKTDNVLNAMSRPSTDSLTRMCAFMFALGTVAPSIPVRSIMLRLNFSRPAGDQFESMLHRDGDGDGDGGDGSSIGGPPPVLLPPLHKSRRAAAKARDSKFAWAIELFTCSEEWAVFWGIIFPWLVSFIFYEGKGFAHLINWTSLTVTSGICFIIPFVLYLRAHMLKRQLSISVDGGRRSEHFKLLRGDGGGGNDDDGDGGGGGKEEDEDSEAAGGRGASLVTDDEEEEDDDDQLVNVFPPSIVNIPYVSSKVNADTIASVLLTMVTLILILQISVNLFFLVFAERDILE